ncbi:hypothetical protein JOC75_003141 [Metabacillus crassostreae]|nr:hypothetical protein [Metabacillus crassostreae]MBM7605118.1 hypothetical protein [Metabacillus crassostreae]
MTNFELFRQIARESFHLPEGMYGQVVFVRGVGCPPHAEFTQ